MKISYRRQPILKLLEEGLRSGNDFTILPKDSNRYLEQIKGRIDPRDLFHSSRSMFDANIKCLSGALVDAVDRAKSKMLDSDLIDSSLTKNYWGTFIDGKLTFCYVIAGRIWNIYVFWDTILIYLYTSGIDATPTKFVSFTAEDVAGNHGHDASSFFLSYLMATINFLKYAEIEVRHLEAHQKVKDINCKYFNDTKSNVQIIDSKWFTTLVKSDAFQVRGHFRLQPKKKDGEWTKELIWINEFQKEGYTAPARILSQTT